MVKTHGCFVDNCNGDPCVFDGVDEDGIPWDETDCYIAIQLYERSLGKDSCPFWLPLKGNVVLEDRELIIGSIELEQLKKESALLNALMAAGVENWEGWDYAMELLEGAE